jgi:hypothetical protein
MENFQKEQVHDLILRSRQLLQDEKPMAALDGLVNALRMMGGEMMVTFLLRIHPHFEKNKKKSNIGMKKSPK